MLVIAVAALVAFQCPDGSPPPCRQAATFAGRAAPSLALNDNTWLVLPFENTTRAADAELIRQASVSQLYGEMSGWTGVRVISDDRVADLVSQLAAAQRERPGLESAIGLARRAGAGRIVLGGYLAVGGRATITAKVYDTRTQRELRVVRQTLSGYLAPAALDSLTTVFARLARGILDLPAGSRNASAGVGTMSADAFRAYAAGMDAFNRIAIDSARILLHRAITLDSNYALAHLQLWRLTPDTIERRPHLEAAIRLAASLPPRARDLVEGTAAGLRRDRPALCRAAQRLVDSDSGDAEGWAMLSGCHFDFETVSENGRPRQRGDWNLATGAAERAYALSPTVVYSINAIIGVLQPVSYFVCFPATAGTCPADRYYRVSLLPSGDSLTVAFNLWRDVKHAPPDHAPAAVAAANVRYRRLLAVCERLAQATDTWIAHFITGQAASTAGDYRTADAHFGRGIPTTTDTAFGNRAIYVRRRFETALALEKDSALNAWADTLFARTDAPAQYRSMMGHLGENSDTTPGLRQNAVFRRIFVGIVPDDFDTLLARITARTAGTTRDEVYQGAALAGFHLGYRGAALDTAARHPLKRYQAWFARGNVPRARSALDEFDRALTARDEHTPDDGGWLFSAESRLELGDSAVALERLQEFARRWGLGFQDAYIVELRAYQSLTARLWGRTWLLYGDLAAARSSPASARRAYRMVVALWGRGDDLVQPMVARARAYLAQQ